MKGIGLCSFFNSWISYLETGHKEPWGVYFEISREHFLPSVEHCCDVSAYRNGQDLPRL